MYSIHRASGPPYCQCLFTRCIVVQDSEKFSGEETGKPALEVCSALLLSLLFSLSPGVDERAPSGCGRAGGATGLADRHRGASLQLRATAVRCRAGLRRRQQRVQSLERSLVVPLPWPAVGPIARSPCCGPAAATCARSLAGCNQFGTRLADVDGALELMAELGIDELDTARGYGGGESEAALGVALEKIKAARGADALPFIATKAQPPLGYDASVAKLDESLSALRMPSVDLWYLHSPDADASLEDTLRAVGEAHAAGKVKEWGVSNFTAWQVVQVVAYCKEHGIAQPTVYQGSYHVLQRQAEDELLPALRAHGIRYYAYSPLGWPPHRKAFLRRDADRGPLRRRIGEPLG
jgi:diketogulonate reductase-like aldo/keto reductase